jgi:hypothetical protein
LPAKKSHVHAEEQSVDDVVAAIAGTVVEEQRLAAGVGLNLEVSVPPRSNLQVEREQWKSCNKLDQRRMLGIQIVLAVLPVHVAGIDVVGFVPARRFLERRQGNLGDHDQNERNGREYGPVPPEHWLLPSDVFPR